VLAGLAAAPVASATDGDPWHRVTGEPLAAVASALNRDVGFPSRIRCFRVESLSDDSDRVYATQSRWALAHPRACAMGDGWGWSVLSSSTPDPPGWVVEFTGGTGGDTCSSVAASVPSSAFVAGLRARVVCF
jgi:hypothetical protein